MRLFRHCTAAVLALTISAAAQTPAPVPAAGEATFIVFLGGVNVGREQVNVARVGSNWIISSRGRFGPPLDFSIDRFELKYSADWQPVELNIEAAQRGRRLRLATSFAVTTAINEITQQGITNSKNDQISARTVVLPSNFYAAYEALAVRLRGAEAGNEVPAYVAPQAEIRIRVKQVSAGEIAVPRGSIATTQFDLLFQNPGGALDASLTVDDRSRFVRLDIPAAALTVIREDVAGVAARPLTTRNPTDSDAMIPASGFTIAATLTTPPETGRLRHPAIVLVGGGSGPLDRDVTIAGIPIFTQLAGALAKREFLVARYDKRGIGQSGGRDERATLQDYADDLLHVVRWLRKRKDVDSRRVAVAGYSEGGAVALLAASREDDIASLVLIATPGTTGAELVLEQQRHVLDVLKTPDADRRAKIELQQKIHDAVKTEKGWEGIPLELRTPADTPWFRSFLLFDPAKTVPRVKQPILIVQGGRDMQVFAHHAGRLAELAKARKKGSVEVVELAGLNHLLVNAETGEVSEYPTLKERTVSPEVVDAIARWLLR